MSDVQPPPPPAPLPSDLPHDSLKPNIIASSAICWVIAAFFVGLRFYTRGVIIHVIGWSDWSILVALIFAAATCAAVIEQAVHGAGQHVWDLDPNDTESAIGWARSAWYGVLFYLFSLCFSKVAILLLYIHLFTFKSARLAGQILLVIVIVSTVYMAAITFTACIPLHSYWDFTVPQQYCHEQPVWWSNTGLHMVTDFLIFLVPMPVVWSIKLPRRQKVMLSGVFGFGFLVCFISILRLLQLIRVQGDQDFTYAAAELSYLTAVEVNGAIVCACVMTLKPLLARFFPRLLGSRRASGSSGASASASASRHRNRRRNRASETLVGGPPTIGSRPSKAPLSAVDMEMMGKFGRSATWAENGYVEIDDTWAADVELAENARPKRGDGGNSGSGGGGGTSESGGVREDTEVRVEVLQAER